MTRNHCYRGLKVSAGHHRYDLPVLVRNLEAAATFFPWIIDAISQVLVQRTLRVSDSYRALLSSQCAGGRNISAYHRSTIYLQPPFSLV